MDKIESSDTHFFNSFSLVLGILIFVTIVFFVTARRIGGAQLKEQTTEQLYLHAVESNTAPFAREAIAGQDNTALAAVATAAAAPAADVPKTGQEAFKKVCSSCHLLGINGAPKIGDHAAWGPRIAEGKATLYQHAMHGYNKMPARGGTTWPDATIRAAVDYMVSLNK